MTRIIGGMFGLESGTRTTDLLPKIVREDVVRLATARSAFTLLARQLRPGTAWLPSYLCDVVLGAFALTGTPVRFYPVDDALQLADQSWLTRVQPGDMAVFIDYFGFNTWADAGIDARARGAWIVEDACQSMLNDLYCEAAHYVIASPRKFVGVPDGGLLMAQGSAPLTPGELPPAPASWWANMLRACELRAEFDHRGGSRDWFELFRANDLAAPLEPVQMSALTADILSRRVDYVDISARRRDNYHALASRLRTAALFPDLPPGVVPLGFPVRLNDRDRVRERLFSEQIYPPVHWPIAASVPEEFVASHRLAGSIMTLPCDQRYGAADMQGIVAGVQEIA